MNRRALVFTNGELPAAECWQDLLLDNPLLVAADGAANRMHLQGITPHVVVGDLDSLRDRAELVALGVQIIHRPGQEDTDLEKALDYIIDRGVHEATVLGVTGLRSDFTMANFCILLKYRQRLKLAYRDAFADITVIEREQVFSPAVGALFSIIPMTSCVGVTTSGLQWPLHEEMLAPGVRESISNRVVASPVIITMAEGLALVFVAHAFGSCAQALGSHPAQAPLQRGETNEF